MSEAKLDAAGEAQQVMMMLAMWRDLVKMVQPPPPPPPERPIELVGDIGEDALYGLLGVEGLQITRSREQYPGAVDEMFELAISEFEEWATRVGTELNSFCWRMSLPDQPVIIREQCITSTYGSPNIFAYEVLTVPASSSDQMVRLGWMPGQGLLPCVRLLYKMREQFRALRIHRMYLEKHVKQVQVRQLRFMRHDRDEGEVYGRIVDGWLFVCPNLQALYV